jgi:hypothetical protein
METTGRVIQKKCLTLETKQSDFFFNLESKWSKFGEHPSLPNSWGAFCRKSTFNLN